MGCLGPRVRSNQFQSTQVQPNPFKSATSAHLYAFASLCTGVLNLSGCYRHGARAALEGSLTKERAAHAATIEVKESAEDTVAKQAAEIAALEASLESIRSMLLCQRAELHLRGESGVSSQE